MCGRTSPTFIVHCALPLQVWFVDGTVKCFSGGHIPLALLAIFCLALCVAAILAPIMLLTYQRSVDVSVHRMHCTIPQCVCIDSITAMYVL